MKRISAILMAFVLMLCILLPAVAEMDDDLRTVGIPDTAYVFDPNLGLYVPVKDYEYSQFVFEEIYKPTEAEVHSILGLWSVRGEDGQQIGVAVVSEYGVAAIGLDGGEPVCGMWNITRDSQLSIQNVRCQEIMCFDGVGEEELTGKDDAQGWTLVREIVKLPEILPEMCGEWVGEGTNRTKMTINADGTVRTKFPGRFFPSNGYWFGLGERTAVFVYDDMGYDVLVLDGADRLEGPLDVQMEEMDNSMFGIGQIVEIYGLIRKGK